MTHAKARVIDTLRAQIRKLEGIGEPAGAAVMRVGLPPVDRVLPDGGLPLGCVHEVVSGEHGAATGFCAVLSARVLETRGSGTLLWLQRGDDLYLPGLVRYGIAPGGVITVAGLTKPADMLWALEEALKCNALGAVVAEVDQVGFTASRRLQLAAESAGITGFLISRDSNGVAGATSAAVTRWRLTSAPSQADGLPGVGAPCWQVELLRARGGRPASWSVVWQESGWHVLPPLAPAQQAEDTQDAAPAILPLAS